MANFTANRALDLPSLIANGSLSEFFEFGEVVTGTETTLVVTYSDEFGSEQLTLTGTFGDYVDGSPTTGTVTGVVYATGGSDLFTVTNMSMSVATFTDYATTDNLAGLFGEVLAGADVSRWSLLTRSAGVRSVRGAGRCPSRRVGAAIRSGRGCRRPGCCRIR